MRRRKIWKGVLYAFASFLLLLLIGMGYLVWVSGISEPKPADLGSLQWKRTEQSPGFYTLKNSWFRKSRSGLYELYVEGGPFERGVVNGDLCRELVQKQEDYFSEQINRMIPSPFYLHFLKYFVGWFNRDLDKHVTEEYKKEIYGISKSASDRYQYIGTNYQRILNYHAAHDIGHALQNLALVGCTSFGTWDAASADSTMIIGRNFDFYVGDKFAENKIVAFVNPADSSAEARSGESKSLNTQPSYAKATAGEGGYKFMSITWAGFIGVVSGMNEKGLTVTINAAKSSIPSGSATPVSLVAREILQYAQNIQEAVAIAKKRKMFVSESFLVGSAEDHKAVTIEKTPDSVEVYDPRNDFIVCTNHFQSNGLGRSKPNEEQMKESASVYRYQRLMELLDANGKNTVQKTVDILRDRRGLHNADIGLGNEKAINQLIAHHAVVFEPEKLRVWVSTAPWQLGQFVAYDLNKVFSLRGMKQDREICDSNLTIAADTFLLTRQFRNFETFRKYRQRLANKEQVNPDSLVASNPEFYHAYVLAGDECFREEQYQKAITYYTIALTKVIATKKEKDYISKQIDQCSKHLK